MQVVDERLTPAQTRAQTATNAFRHYLLWLILVPATLYVLGFLFVRMPGYERWGGSSWGPILDYAFQVKNQNADIVIFGDSSAIFAVDPVMVSKQLQMKVINLPNTIGGLPVIGDMALQQYLQKNQSPRLIVFYFCKWDLNYSAAKGTRLFEGEEMLARHGTWLQILGFSLHHPAEVFYFPFRVYSGFGPGALLHALRHRAEVPEVVASRGHVDYVLSSPLPSDCMLPAAELNESHSKSVRDLMLKYSSAGTRTMLYLAPVPGCVNVQSLLSSSQPGVAPPAVFPPSDFAADTYYAHLRPNAVDSATRLLTGAIRLQLRDVR